MYIFEYLKEVQYIRSRTLLLSSYASTRSLQCYRVHTVYTVEYDERFIGYGLVDNFKKRIDALYCLPIFTKFHTRWEALMQMNNSMIFWGQSRVVNGVWLTKRTIHPTTASVPVTLLTQPSFMDGFPANSVQESLIGPVKVTIIFTQEMAAHTKVRNCRT